MRAVSRVVFAVSALILSVSADSTPTTGDAITTTTDCVRYHKTGFWDVDILNWDLDPKACGPPLSHNAVTDRSRLPAEVCALVGAYAFFICTLGLLLITFGRKARRAALGANGTTEIEMINSPPKSFDNPPLSPTKSWLKKGVGSIKSIGGHSSRTSRVVSQISDPVSPGATSITSFDAKFLQDDQSRRQAEMERLYAAVMAHDEARKSQQVSIQETEIRQSRVQQPIGLPSSPMRPISKPKMHLDITESTFGPPRPRTAGSEVGLPLSPRSPVRAIYPPHHNFPSDYPIGPTSPIIAVPINPAFPLSPGLQRVPLPDDMYPASPPPRDIPAMTFPEPPASPRAILRKHSSQGTLSSTASSGTKSRKLPLRNLRISPPVMHDDEDCAPLTPRYYQDPGQPPQPPTPLTAATVRTNYTMDSVDSDYRYESRDQPAPLPLPQAQPQRTLAAAPPPKKQVTLNLPVATSRDGHSSIKSASSSVNNLPLRAYSDTSSIASPAATKTTFLERRLEALGHGPRTARTPRTGVPQTPYSPYMPFTPMTPVTPHLVSRKERKERIKAEGKKLAIEEEAVKDESEMWE